MQTSRLVSTELIVAYTSEVQPNLSTSRNRYAHFAIRGGKLLK